MSCTAIPLDEISRWGTRVVNWAERLGFELL
jgi:hypothetical protein